MLEKDLILKEDYIFAKNLEIKENKYFICYLFNTYYIIQIICYLLIFLFSLFFFIWKFRMPLSIEQDFIQRILYNYSNSTYGGFSDSFFTTQYKFFFKLFND